MIQAYEFAVDKIGLDYHSYQVCMVYFAAIVVVVVVIYDIAVAVGDDDDDVVVVVVVVMYHLFNLYLFVYFHDEGTRTITREPWNVYVNVADFSGGLGL